jgi:hypothetical protein
MSNWGAIKQLLAILNIIDMDEQHTIDTNEKTMREIWFKYVKEYGGLFVLWVEQSTDPRLKVHNSKGVCWAMANEFVLAYQAGLPGPSDFVNGIRNANLIWPGTSRIPPKYLQIQSALQARNVQYTNNLDILDLELICAEEEDKPAIQVKLKKFKDDHMKQWYGPGMTSYETFIYNPVQAPTEILKQMKVAVTKNGPSYFHIIMRDLKGGHAIAFGYREDLAEEAIEYPGIYEFFDANLGLFVFRSEEKLSDFFKEVVWAKLYKSTDYFKFEIVSITAKKGQR